MMIEPTIRTQISVRPAEQGLPARSSAAPQAESGAAAKLAAAAFKQAATAVKQAPAQEKAAPPEKAPRPPVETSSAALVGNASNIALQFRVDEKTKDVTVFVVDKASKKVLRSIPASELAKLGAGELLKMTA